MLDRHTADHLKLSDLTSNAFSAASCRCRLGILWAFSGHCLSSCQVVEEPTTAKEEAQEHAKMVASGKPAHVAFKVMPSGQSERPVAPRASAISGNSTTARRESPQTLHPASIQSDRWIAPRPPPRGSRAPPHELGHDGINDGVHRLVQHDSSSPQDQYECDIWSWSVMLL